MFESCQEKERSVRALFNGCQDEQDKYKIIINLGKGSEKLAKEEKIPENLVKGCQSRMYLHANYQNGKVYFKTESDALISSGLAELLTRVYSGETPETILKYPPNYLEELGITASITPNRANGLYSLHLRMKQEALKKII